MFKKSLLFTLLLALLVPWAAKAQTALLEENFNSMLSLATSYSATDWYAYNAGSGNNWTLNSSSGVSSSKCAQYKYNYSNAANCYLVSAPFDVNANMEELGVSLYEKVESQSYPETFEVFFVKASDVIDNASITSATKYMAIASASYTNTSYTEQTGSNDNSALTGQSVRLVVHCTSAKNQYYLYIDDITVTQTIASSCSKPDTFEHSNVTANSATLTWTGGSGTYNVEYKKASDADWTVALTNTTLLTTDLTLEPATNYEARVQSVCTGENSGWKTTSFNTDCGVINTFPKSYGFETSEGFPTTGNTPTTNQLGVCWRNEATVQSGNYANRVWGTSTDYKKNGSQSLILPDKGSGSKTMLVFPEMNFSSPNGYIVSFWIYRNGSNSATANPEGFKVYISDCDTIGPNAVFLGHYSRNYGIAYPQTESTSGWYNYEIVIPQTTMTGNVHLIFEGQSYYGNATYVDDVKIEVAPTCKKPSGLAKDATTAHTATLHWTNGEATQDAWQIAYSTSSSFAPADNFTPGEGEGLADVTTNPGTIGGLAQSTTYYAYVRANCGGGDYSPWSNAKVSFSTISGKQKPTDLAVLNSTITSDQARVVWKGVATNELHESFEVYYSRLSTKPDPLEADSLIVVSGAVDTTYLFTNLDAEQKYYVWVRDNCGTDGYSDWTSSINFTTASACQTPNGVNAIEVTQTTAKISWNTYGLTEFNLRFKQKDAADWNPTIEGITCPYTISTNLTPNTEYLVQVQGTCADAETWSASGSFTTECGPISVASEAYFYDFETTLKFNCWDVLTGTSSIQEVTSPSYASYYHSATHYLRFIGTTSNVIVLPQFVEETNTLQISFWHRPESNSAPSSTNNYSGKFAVGYMTDPEDASTFHAIETFVATDWTTLTHRQFTCYLDSAPNGAYIAFRQYDCQYNYYWFVDDVEVSVAPLCRPVKNLAYSNVTNHSATITWTKGTEDQDTWQLKYNKEDDFDPDTEGTLVDNLDATTYTFNKTLDATSVYYIYVRANCGGAAGNSPWTKTIINTLALKPVPTGLTVDNTTLTPVSVSLDWTPGGGDYENSWDIYVATTSSPAPTAETTPTHAGVTTHPYTVSLTSGSANYIYVRGIHGSDGASNWSSYKYVSAPEACPKPTAVSTGSATPNSLTLSWTAGASWQTSWTIAYSETTGFDPTDATACTYVDVDENPFVIDNLDSDKTYYFRIKGNCGTTYGESEWNTTQASGKTLVACPAPTALAANNITHTTADLTWTGYSDSYTVEYQTSAYNETIFFEDFESGSTGWTTQIEGEGPGWALSTDFSHSTSHSMTAYSYDFDNGSAYNADNWLISPQITMGKTLKFWAYQKYSDEYEVLFSTSNSISSFNTELQAMATVSPSQTWVEFTVDLTAIMGQTGYIAIHHVMYDGGWLSIDDFGIYGDEVPAGGWTEATTSATDGAYTIEGLTANTKYDVRVKGNCGGEYSDVYSFTTYGDNTKIFKTTGNWNVAGNWDGGIPTAAHNAIIRANVEIPNACVATANNVTLEGAPAPTITIKDGGQLVHNNDDLVVTMEKVITGYSDTQDHYYLLAVPTNYSASVNPATVTGMLDNEYDLYSFDYTEPGTEWQNYEQSAFNLYAGEAYLYANSVTTTLTFTGEVLASYDNYYWYGLSYDNNDTYPFDGWNLVGNLYTCNAYLVKENSTDETFFYQINGNEVVASTGAIAPLEGVFVKTSTENIHVYWNRTAPAKTGGHLNLTVSQSANNRESNDRYDRAIVSFGTGEGLEKFQLNPNHTKVYIPQEGKDYAVVNAESHGEMPVNFKAAENGSYTISFNAENVEFSYLHLIDNLTGNEVNLLETPSYSFDARTIDYASRFKLVFVTGQANMGDDFGFFDANGNLMILGIEGTATLQMIDVTGRIISSETFSGNYSKAINAKAGVYMLRLIQGNDVRTQKIVVK